MKRIALRKSKQQFWQNAALATALFALCFTLFSSMRSKVFFIDEMDNFYIGLQLTKGAVLYDTIFSQHMPLMYYICAGFAKLGAHTVLEFRMCWYVLLSLCYVMLFLRYSKWVGRVAMLLWPEFYVLAITNEALCTSILAEQLQAIGMVMLLLEFWHFTQTKEVSPASALCIAIGINISFLSAFVAAFGCAAIVLSYIIFEIIQCVKRKFSLGHAIAVLWKKYRLTIGLTLLPMVVFTLLFAVQGNLDDFIYKAYTLNREIYSQYQGGFGDSPWQAVLGCVLGFVDFGKMIFQTLFQGAAKVPAISMMLLAAYGAFLALLLLRKQVFAAVALGVFFLLCGSRGFYNFHALQIFALSALALALLVGAGWRTARRGNTLSKRIGALVLASLLCTSTILLAGKPVWEFRTELYPAANEWNPPPYEAHSNETLIMALTDPGEYILENINKEDLFLHTHARAPVYNTACSPWWWEGTKERSMQEIIKNPPRVAIYDPAYTAFEKYQVQDFAPEMDAFIKANYTQLYDDAPYFYVRNDYLEAAKARLPADDSSMVPCTDPNMTCGDTLSAQGVVQRFEATRPVIDTISAQFGTHSRPYRGTATVRLTEVESGKEIAAYTVSGKEIADNAFTPLHTPDMPPLKVTPGNAYELTVTMQPKNDDNLTLWASENEATAQSYAIVNGERQNYTLRIKVR